VKHRPFKRLKRRFDAIQRTHPETRFKEPNAAKEALSDIEGRIDAAGLVEAEEERPSCKEAEVNACRCGVKKIFPSASVWNGLTLNPVTLLISSVPAAEEKTVRGRRFKKSCNAASGVKSGNHQHKKNFYA
jgi:hypothetical protein